MKVFRRALLAVSLLLGASGAVSMLNGPGALGDRWSAGMAALLLGSLGVGFWLLLWGDKEPDQSTGEEA